MGKWRGGRVGGRSEGKDKSVNKDEMGEYRSRVEVGAQGQDGDGEAEFMKHIEDIGEVAGLEQRWVNSWKTSLQTRFVTSLSPHMVSNDFDFNFDQRSKTPPDPTPLQNI